MKQILVFGGLFLSVLSYGQTPTLQQVTTSGNTTTNEVTFSGYRTWLKHQTAQLRFGNLTNEGSWGLGLHGGLTGDFFLYNLLNNTISFTVKPNNNVGIGVPDPQAKLHIEGATVSNIYGVVTPTVKLYSTNAPAVGEGGILEFGGNTGNTTAKYAFGYIAGLKESTTANNYGGYLSFRTVSTGANGEVNSANYERMRISSTGAILINTTTAPSDYKLVVNGNVIAEKIAVKLKVNWADFVFKPDYKLPPLSMVEQHIKEKGHLPNIPSEKEVAENGIDLGSMDAKLLQKVEELTLYVIKQEKRSDEQQKQNDLMKMQIEELKKQNELLMQIIKQK